MPLVEQEVFILPEHLSSPPVFSRIRVAQSLVFHVVFCKTLFGLFCHCVVWPSSDFVDPFGIFKLFIHGFYFILGDQIWKLYMCFLCAENSRHILSYSGLIYINIIWGILESIQNFQPCWEATRNDICLSRHI